MKPCRECGHEISESARQCPECGAPFPAKEKWNGYGFEYKSPIAILGLPLLHVSFKYRANRMPVPAVGVISIGQFGCGVINISQFGLGVVCVAQAGLGVYAVAQLAAAYSLIAQLGLYVDKGYGQFVLSVGQLLSRLF